jgi:hypothetical protein
MTSDRFHHQLTNKEEILRSMLSYTQLGKMVLARLEGWLKVFGR